MRRSTPWRAPAGGGGLIVRHGRAEDEIPRLAAALGVDKVFANRDYEPDAIVRDSRVAQVLAEDGIGYEDFKDQVIFERDEVLTQTGKPYSVFTPYKNAWLKKVDDFQVRAYPSGKVRRTPGAEAHRRDPAGPGRNRLRADQSRRAEHAGRHERRQAPVRRLSPRASSATSARATFRR